jgi:predicted homoserine dehydrogenase-like protein
MNLASKLQSRAAEGRPVHVGVIGTGKFGSMFLAQARSTPGIVLTAVADLDEKRARAALSLTGWPSASVGASSAEAATPHGGPWLTEDSVELIAADGVDVVVEATGNPEAGVRHALACIEHRKHIVMVNVEADVLLGARLSALARAAGVGYSLAYGDQPALICELVDWARTAGFDVVCAGKGTKYLPEYHVSTPDTVWGHYGFSDEQVAGGDYNAKMFNSFLDGTKSSIEMAAVANATGLMPPENGLAFPPASLDELPSVLRPRAVGGVLEAPGTVEVVSSLRRDGTEIAQHLRWGVYVTFTTDNLYTAKCFGEYGVVTDDTGRYASLYRPYHFIGLELGVSVASIALRDEPTGAPRTFAADAVAVAKRGLRKGEELDGEGGATVYGTCVPARRSVEEGLLPIGLAGRVELLRDIPAGEPVRWSDVDLDDSTPIAAERRAMEREQGIAAITAAGAPT